jgi:hypothetical protein
LLELAAVTGVAQSIAQHQSTIEAFDVCSLSDLGIVTVGTINGQARFGSGDSSFVVSTAGQAAHFGYISMSSTDGNIKWVAQIVGAADSNIVELHRCVFDEASSLIYVLGVCAPTWRLSTHLLTH